MEQIPCACNVLFVIGVEDDNIAHTETSDTGERQPHLYRNVACALIDMCREAGIEATDCVE